MQIFGEKWYRARQGSNLQPSAPEAGRAHATRRVFSHLRPWRTFLAQRKVAVGLVLGLLGPAVPAFAQHATAPDPVWYPGYVICGHQDYPNYDPAATNICGYSDPHQTTPITVNRGSVYIAGWAFVAFDGSLPDADSVRVSYDDAQGVRHFLTMTIYQRLYRPDVHDALVGTFPNVTNYTGYAFYFNDPSALPLGTYTFHVQQTAITNTLGMADSFTLTVVQ